MKYLKRKGYRPKKLKILKGKPVKIFMNKASDVKYLMIKVAAIFGLFVPY